MQRGKRDSQKPGYRTGLTDGRAGRGPPSPERPKARQGLVFIHQIPKASLAGLQLISTPTTESTSKRGNGRYTPSRCYSKIRSFILSFARPVMAFTYSLSLANCNLSAHGSYS